MTPFFFGTAERRLFGILAPRQKNGGSDRGIVLCHPWGMEYLRAHRSMRQLAKQLSRAGLDVLRFDYFGSGDSSGEMTAGDLAGWCDDIGSAIDELRDATGIAKVGLVGLRLGATLAAKVAAGRRGDVDSLVLWDPVVSGNEYAAEILGRHGPDRRSPELVHVDGFPLTRALQEQFLAIDLLQIAPSFPERTLTLVSEPLPSHAALGAVCAVETIEAERAWYQERSFSVGALPTNVLRRIVEWHG